MPVPETPPREVLMRYSLFVLLFLCLGLWSCDSKEYVLVNETKYTITSTGWIDGMNSTTEVITLEPGRDMIVQELPPHDTVRYTVGMDVGIAYFDDVRFKKITRATVRLSGNYPQLVIENSGGAPVTIVGSLDAVPGFELSWEGEPPADKRPDADGMFSYSQFPRGMSIGELDWILAGHYEQSGGGPRMLPLLFAGLKWQGAIYEYEQISHDNTAKSYRGSIYLEAEPSAQRLEKTLDEICALGFRPVFFRNMNTGSEGGEVDFREAAAGPDKPEEQKKELRRLLENTLAAEQGKATCILVSEDAFQYLAGPINTHDFLCWVIRLNMQEKSMQVIDTNTRSWVNLAFF